MSNYTKLTDFAAKDALLTGNPAKVVKGTELGAEFDAIVTAVATKVDSSGALGTPTSGTLTNCTGLPISTGVSGLAANVAAFLATPSSSNLISAVTDETGSGALVFANTPTLVTPVLGTPTSGTLTNCTGLPLTGVTSALSGIIKCNGSSTFSAATAGTDYVAPGTATTFTAQQTFCELKDTVYTITDGAAFEIDPANGSIQVVTLGANRSPAATNFEAGQTILLGIDDGSAYTVTWPSVTWVKSGGTAAAPTLATSGYTWVVLWKQGTTLFGSIVGSP